MKGEIGMAGEPGYPGEFGMKGEKGLPGAPGPRVSEIQKFSENTHLKQLIKIKDFKFEINFKSLNLSLLNVSIFPYEPAMNP